MGILPSPRTGLLALLTFLTVGCGGDPASGPVDGGGPDSPNEMDDDDQGGDSKSPECEGDTKQQRERCETGSVPHGGQCRCEKQERSCSDGSWSEWSGTFEEDSCIVGQPAACDGKPDGTIENRVRFAASSVAYDATCSSETQSRSCTDGEWSLWTGTYAESSCSVGSAGDCGATPHSGSEVRVRYEATSVAYGQTCIWENQTRTCDDGIFGSWSGTYTSDSCTVAGSADCEGEPHGAEQSRTRYETATVPYGSTCSSESQTRSCDDGSWSDWSGSFSAQSCHVMGKACTGGAHGTIETRSCGTNGNGRFERECVDGAWIEGACDNDFVSSWSVRQVGASDDNTVELPLVSNGNYDFEVDWGDGTTSTVTAWGDEDRSHVYSGPGTYTVTIRGTIVGWSFGQAFVTLGPRQKLKEISRFGPLDLGDTEEQFESCDLDISAEDAPGLSATTSLSYAFYDADIGKGDNLALWDVSNVTDMSYMFYRSSDFNADLHAWNVGQVQDMTRMFYQAQFFNGNVGPWDVSAVESMMGMFARTDLFNQDIGEWDVSNVQDMRWMFSDAAAFNQDLGSWNTEEATLMTSMFERASSFDQDLSDWDVAAVTSLDSFVSGTNVSTAHYTLLLVGWASQSVQANLTLNSGDVQYAASAATARQSLINDHGWTIVDGGQAP